MEQAMLTQEDKEALIQAFVFHPGEDKLWAVVEGIINRAVEKRLATSRPTDSTVWTEEDLQSVTYGANAIFADVPKPLRTDRTDEYEARIDAPKQPVLSDRQELLVKMLKAFDEAKDQDYSASPNDRAICMSAALAVAEAHLLRPVSGLVKLMIDAEGHGYYQADNAAPEDAVTPYKIAMERIVRLEAENAALQEKVAELKSFQSNYDHATKLERADAKGDHDAPER